MIAHGNFYLFYYQEGVDVSYKVAFEPHGTGADLWDDLQEDGKLNSTDGKADSRRKVV